MSKADDKGDATIKRAREVLEAARAAMASKAPGKAPGYYYAEEIVNGRRCEVARYWDGERWLNRRRS